MARAQVAAMPPPRVASTLESDHALVARILGPPRAELAAARLLARFALSGLRTAGLRQLCEVGGVGSGRARRLCAALELGRRSGDEPLARGAPIRGADDVHARLRSLATLDQEELHVLGLDSQSRLVVHFVAARGTLNQVYASPRDVFRPLLREAVCSAVVVHNHPSGDCAPSEADAELTRRLVDAGRVVGVAVVDHVVIASEGRYSFAEHRRLG